MLVGWDIDGVITAGLQPQSGAVVVSGRTWAEYDDVAKTIAAQFPTYIRGKGEYGDHEAAAYFKATMIWILGITEFHEDHPLQAKIIAGCCPNVTVIRHGRAAE